MMTAPHQPQMAELPMEFELTDADFQRLSVIARSMAGIVLSESKRPLVYSRLTRRLRALHLETFSEYCDVIEGPNGDAEREELLLSITTNVTAFYREKHHFDYLEQKILPDLVARARSGGRVRIWSSACSSGEEPYSIALTLLGLCPEAKRLNIKILATDIDRNVLTRAAAGLYPAEGAASIPTALARKFVDQTDDPETVQMGAAARALISFKRLNLMEKWPFKGPFDVIFCRNVVIYFDRPTQEALWPRFEAVLAPAGHIMIGHSERIAGPAASRFGTAGITTYQKR